MLLFRVADLARDASLLKMVPGAADTLLREHPGQVDRLIRRWIGDASRFAGV
jgi:ATP-dependent DNA helicase RecG